MAGLWGLAAAPAARAAANPVAAAGAQPIAGPSTGLTSLNGMSIARDGTGGVVFLSQVSGAEHVFVSRLTGGVFGSPEQVDTGLSGASGQPVIAAGNNGLLLVGFINSGNLYVSQTPGASASFAAPVKLHTGAENPALQMTNWGKAYLAYTAPLGSGHYDVDAEYYDNGAWQAVSAPLNVTPGDDAGTGVGRPSVAAAGDGVGIVAWGENGHVYARRVWGTSPSVEDEQLDPPNFGGAAEVSSGTPVVSVGGDSPYPDIAYDEQLSSGPDTWNRVLMTRLIAEDVGDTVAVDNLSESTPGNAGQPAIAMSEYGRGYVLAGDDSTDQLIGMPLTNQGVPAASPAPVSQGPSTAPIAGVPAVAGTSAVVLAWEQSSGQPEVVERYTPDGTTLGAPQVLSAPGAQVQPGDGLAAAGDNGGDAAVAWVQGSNGALSLEAAQLYQPPIAGQPSVKSAYARTPTPTLRWSAGQARWGPLRYQVTLGGHVIGHTSATSLKVPEALVDGPHTWTVTTTNPAGQSATGRKSTVFVDTVPPEVSFSLSGRRRAHRRLSLHLHAVDAPAPQPGARASTVATVRIDWGDGSGLLEDSNLTRAHHVYLHRGGFRIKVAVTDRAGNRTTVTRTLRIAK
ncbi:MAG TPA: hypothetical protein VG405_10150 [Solirubrobacteraceae bacterium]|nr:hypothetical protein [Solirubrobacteraceae bacterium]